MAPTERRRHQFQKKACTHPSKTGLTLPVVVCDGKPTKHRLDPSRLVFLDETWAKTNMTRTHGRCGGGNTTGCKGAAWAVANTDLSGGAAVQSPRCAMRHRWADQWRKLSRLCRAVPCPDAVNRRCRHYGQSRQPQRTSPCVAQSARPAQTVFSAGLLARISIRSSRCSSKLKTLLRKSDARTSEATWRRIGELLRAREIAPERPRTSGKPTPKTASCPPLNGAVAPRLRPCGAFAVVVATGSNAALAQAGLPVRNIRVEQSWPLLIARALSGRLTPKGGTRRRDDRGC